MPDKRNLPDWIDAFMALTENSEPPLLFRKWTAISTIASALQRKVRVEWGTSLVFYPNLYVVLVGPSATGKGTAMNFALDIMSEVPAIRLSAQATSLQALISRLKETNLTDIDIATNEQIYHSSLTIFSKEFTVFLGYHNRELMSSLCDWYDCDSKWTYDTIKRKAETIVGVWVNMLAGTTPDSIQSSLPIESIGGGLTSRIIFVNEEKKEKLVALPTQTKGEAELQQMLVYDLENIYKMSGVFHYTQDFVDSWVDWCHAAEANPPFYDKKFDGYCGRRRAHLMKLSMIISASHGQNGLVLTKDDLDEATKLLNEVEVRMGLTFRGMGKSDLSGLLSDAITFIENSTTPDIPLWQFARYFEGNMDKFMMDRILFTLESMKRINIVRRPSADTIINILDMEDGSKIKQSDEGKETTQT